MSDPTENPHVMLYQNDAFKEPIEKKGTRSLDSPTGRGELNGRHVAIPTWDAMPRQTKIDTTQDGRRSKSR
jgi:hypothetical protein